MSVKYGDFMNYLSKWFNKRPSKKSHEIRSFKYGPDI